MPDYSKLATATTATASPLASNYLCARNNIVVGSTLKTGVTQIQPPYPGDYHGQKIAWSDAESKVYAIGCSTQTVNEGGTSLGVGVSFEACIRLCSATVGCPGVNYVNKPGANSECKQNTVITNNPPQIIGTDIGTGFDLHFYARLLEASGNRAKVVDNVHFLGNNRNVSNLGLCDNGNYDGAFISVQQRQAYFRSGSNGQQFIKCGASDMGSGVALNTSSEWAALGYTSAGPSTADSCARLCTYTYIENSLVTERRCEAWVWMGTNTTTGTCKMYPTRRVVSNQLVANAAVDPDVVAAGGYAGNLQQFNGVVSYKRSITMERTGRANLMKRDALLPERVDDLMRPDHIFQV